MFKEPKFAKESQSSFASYFSAKLAKQKSQTASRVAAKSDLFKGIVCYVNGFSDSEYSAHAINHMIAQHGGTFDYVLRSKTTHWVCQVLPDGKVNKELSTKRRKKLHFVKPEWVVDSIKQNKVLPESEYSIWQFNPTQPKSNFFKPKAKLNTKQSQQNDKNVVVLYICLDDLIGTCTDDATVVLNEEGVVLLSRHDKVRVGMTQQEMVIALRDVEEPRIVFLTEEQIQATSQKFAQVCKNAFNDLNPQMLQTSRDAVLLQVPSTIPNIATKLSTAQLIGERLSLIRKHFKIKVQEVNGGSNVGMTFVATANLESCETEGVSPSKKKAIYEKYGKLNSVDGLAYRLQDENDLNAQSNKVENNQSKSKYSFSIDRRFGCHFTNDQELSVALNALIKQGMDTARSVISEEEHSLYLVQIELRWSMPKSPKNTFLMDNISLNQTSQSASRRTLRYLTEVAKAQKIKSLMLQFTLCPRKLAKQLRHLRQDHAISPSSTFATASQTQPASCNSLEKGNTEPKKRDGARTNAFDSPIAFSGPVIKKRKYGLDFTPVQNPEEIEVCIIPDIVEQRHSTPISNTTESSSRLYPQVEKTTTPLNPKTLSDIKPDMAKEIPEELLKEVREELKQLQQGDSSKQQNDELKANPTCLEDICPAVAQEIPKDILAEIENELSRDGLNEGNRAGASEVSRVPVVEQSSFAYAKPRSTPVAKAMPSQVSDIDPEIAKEIPPDMLRAIKQSLMKGAPKQDRVITEPQQVIQPQPLDVDDETEDILDTLESFASIREALRAYTTQGGINHASEVNKRGEKVTEYVSVIISAGDLVKVEKILLYLRRTVAERLFQYVYEHVQKEVKERYGSKLRLPQNV